MRFFLLATLLAEGVAIGYIIGKADVDEKVARMIKAGTTEFIAYAKSVPPAVNAAPERGKYLGVSE
jgi:hypothetical protein